MPQLRFAVDWPALVAENVRRVCDALARREIDLLLVNGVDAVRYLTGFSPTSGPGLVHASWAALTPSGATTLYTFNFYLDSTRAHFPWLEDVRPLPPDMPEGIRSLAEEHGAARARVAFDGHVLYAQGKAIEQLLPSAEIVSADQMLAEIRMRKSEHELPVIERCAAVADIGMRAALDACVAGALEFEVAAEAEYAMRAAGAEGFPYSSVVSSGENAAIMLELSTDKHLRDGEFVMLDLGCLFEGYNSDFARTALVGDVPAYTEQRDAYRVVHAALQAMIGAVRPGTTCADLDRVGRQVIRDAGWGSFEPVYFIGHGIGMAHWEPPLVEAGAQIELAPGMVLALEPGIHKPGIAGLRLEDMVVVTDDGCRVITRTAFNQALL